MKLKKQCSSCEWNWSNKCAEGGSVYKHDEYISDPKKHCENWIPNSSYFYRLKKEAPWYIKLFYQDRLFQKCDFILLIEKEINGEPIPINIYKAIYKTYDICATILANILGVSEGIVTYAECRGTPSKRIAHFSLVLFIPGEYFNKFTSCDIKELEKCRDEFYSSDENKRQVNSIKDLLILERKNILLSLKKENQIDFYIDDALK